MKRNKWLSLLLAACLLLTLPTAALSEVVVSEPAEAAADELTLALPDDGDAAVEAASLPQANDAVPEAPAAAPAPVGDASENAALSPEPAANDAESAPEEFALLKNASKTVNLGARLQLTLGGKTAKKFATSKKAVAEVTSSGLVTARAAGKATITVTLTNKKKLKLKLTVVDPTLPTGVKLTALGKTVNLEETLTLTPVLSPATAQSDYTWKSSNKKIATVKDGVVTGVKEGKVTVTVTTKRGKKSASIKLKVVDPYKPTAIRLTAGRSTVNLGETLTLTPVYTPENARKACTWKSSNKKVATVKDGVVTGVKEGKATITVTTYNKKKATFKVTVVDPLKATAVSLDRTGTVDLPLGQKLQLTAAMTPANSTSKLTWSTSNKKIAKVSASGLVTPVKKGTATITVTTSTKKKASVKVRVVAAVKPPVRIIGQWPGNDLDNAVEMGDEFNTAVSLEPYDATATVTWTSSHPEVARIRRAERDSSYSYQVYITPVSTGRTVITARTDNGLTASFTLTVTTRLLPESIAFDRAGPLRMRVGEKLKISYSVYPGESIGRAENCATLTSSNPAVATVTGKTDNGLMDCSGDMDFTLTVTARAKGTATLTVALRNGVKQSIDVIVQ